MKIPKGSTKLKMNFLEGWRLGWNTQPQKTFSGGGQILVGILGNQTVSLVQVQLLGISAQFSTLFEDDVLFFIMSLS